MKKSITTIALLNILSPVALATLSENEGILISDMKRDAIYLTQDLNNNGTASDAGESTIYFDGNNLSGLADPTKSVFSIFHSPTGYTYIGDGGSDSVYRLADKNTDGDVQDAGEANIWFSQDNHSGFTLPTPNSVYEASDGALYIVNAGTKSQPDDAVYRTIDLNNDGDANDEGEAAVWLNLATLASAKLGGGVPDNKSSAFDITFVGDTAFIADLMGKEADTVFRAQDLNGNGMIDEDELSIFIDDNNAYGVPVATGLVSDKDGSLYVLESSSKQQQTLFRLSDRNSSDTIDGPLEPVEIWNESAVADLGVALGSAFGLALGPDGEMIITSAGNDSKDNLFRLVDINGDKDFLDAGETLLWSIGNGKGNFIEFARAAEYIEIKAPSITPPHSSNPSITPVPVPILHPLALLSCSLGLLLFGNKKTKRKAL